YFINTDTTSTQNGSKITLTGANYSSVITPITFRIYGWNAEDAFGSFGVDDVQVNGNYGAIENVQNYMDYSYCSHMYTNGQKQRMRLALASSLSGRNQLYTAENRALTGTDDNPLSCAPEANFYPSAHFACIGDNITFNDNSTNGTVDTYSWTFEDGTPATSNAENPVVSFNSYGRKTVTLTVLNANGSTTKTIEQCVVIGTDGNEFPGALLQENFDSYDEFYNRWYGINHDNNMSVWQQTAQAGFSNSTSAKLNAYDMDVTFIDEGGQDIDELASGVMDLSDVASGAVVSFKWAFATQSTDLAGITDALEVYISNDCGRTWSGQPRLTIEGTDLVTAGSVSTSFTPSSAADWDEGSFTVPNTYYNDGFRMKFVFLAGDYPNNLYIDDINMSAVVNVEEQIAENFSAVLYPNPTSSTTTLSYINASGEQMNIQLMDLSGRVVRSWNPMTQSSGVQQLVIDTEDLSKGVYMLNLRSDNTSSTLKLMVK
ncbi:MAG: T9SS type A sorting domain-containing protein, partial [Flavobacteriales bacterium]